MSLSAVFALLACVYVSASGVTPHDSDSCKYHAYFFGECKVEKKMHRLFEVFLTNAL
jgi:hypothetical protein